MEGNNQEARTWAMLCHLAALAWLPLAFVGLAIPFANVVGPLIVWLIKKDKHPFVDAQGKESLNFHISLTIYAIVLFVVLMVFGLIYLVAAGVLANSDQGIFLLLGGVIGIGLFGLVMLIALLDLILVILASVQAYSGKSFRYPITIRFLR